MFLTWVIVGAGTIGVLAASLLRARVGPYGAPTPRLRRYHQEFVESVWARPVARPLEIERRLERCRRTAEHAETGPAITQMVAQAQSDLARGYLRWAEWSTLGAEELAGAITNDERMERTPIPPPPTFPPLWMAGLMLAVLAAFGFGGTLLGQPAEQSFAAAPVFVPVVVVLVGARTVALFRWVQRAATTPPGKWHTSGTWRRAGRWPRDEPRPV